MGLARELLGALGNYKRSYRHLRAKAYGYYHPTKKDSEPPLDFQDQSIRVALSRLKKRGFVENKNRAWRITKIGRAYWEKISPLPRHSKVRSERSGPKNIIIIFDIPEVVKKKRDWLRQELVCLGFVMLQKSVWFGPAPLPQEFIDSLKTLHLMPHVKFFEAKEADVI